MSIHRFVNEHSLQFHFQEPQTESNLNVYQQVDRQTPTHSHPIHISGNKK